MTAKKTVVALGVFLMIGSIIFVGRQFYSISEQHTETIPAGATASEENKVKLRPSFTRVEEDEPPKLKNIGFNLDYYNPETGRAGDFHFTRALAEVLSGDPIYQKLIWSDYGIQDIRSQSDPTKRNVQPTFYLPLGTKVLAPIDGEVTMVEILYSNDYTIWFAENKQSTWFYEMEHVINPIVKVGDKVKAGQVVAEVSTHGSEHNPGFGIVEIGLFHQLDGQPAHWCPFVHFDESIKDDMNKKILAFYTAWETYLGDDTIYNNDNYPVPGCATLEPTKESPTPMPTNTTSTGANKPTPPNINQPQPQQTSTTISEASGYSFEITGSVHDMTDAPAMTAGKPMAGITLQVSGPKTLSTETGSDGTYTLSFQNAPLGTYNVCFTLPAGYRSNASCESVLVKLSEQYVKTLELIVNGNSALHGTGILFLADRQ